MFLSRIFDDIASCCFIEFIYIAMGDKLLNDNGQKRFLFGYLKGFFAILNICESRRKKVLCR
jgi:hypothetical protein